VDRQKITADCVKGYRFLVELTESERQLAGDPHRRLATHPMSEAWCGESNMLSNQSWWNSAKSIKGPIWGRAAHSWYHYVQMTRAITCIAFLPGFLPIHAADRMKVKIIDRRDSQTGYSYVVPQRVQSRTNTDVNCSAYPNSVNCSGATNTNATNNAFAEYILFSSGGDVLFAFGGWKDSGRELRE